MTLAHGEGERSMTFGSLDVRYDERVLTPRPWTTEQSIWAAELLEQLPEGDVLELCAGVGHIGLHAVHSLRRRLVMVDLNEVACEFAQINVDAAQISDRVEIRVSRLEEALQPNERFALVIADPPWVPTDSIERFPDDPRIAIDGGNDGLDIAWACLDVISDHLVEGGAAILQLGTIQQAESLGVRSLDHGLVVAEVRSYSDGVLVLIERQIRGAVSPE